MTEPTNTAPNCLRHELCDCFREDLERLHVELRASRQRVEQFESMPHLDYREIAALKVELATLRRNNEGLVVERESLREKVEQLTMERDRLAHGGASWAGNAERFHKEAEAADERAREAEEMASDRQRRIEVLEEELRNGAAALVSERAKLSRLTRDIEESLEKIGTKTEARLMASAGAARIATDIRALIVEARR